MIFEVLAPPIGAGAVELSFRWDSDTGALSGRDAGLVAVLVEAALEDAGVAGHPAPWWIPVSDPLHEPAEMAAVIGESHLLPEPLAAYYPEPPREEPADVEVTY